MSENSPATGAAPDGALLRAPRLTATRLLVFLAWRNLWRNRLRSTLTGAAMVVGLALMIAYLALMEGIFRQMVGFATNITVGHLQVHRQAYLDTHDLYALLPDALLEHLEQTTPYAFAPRMYAGALASAGEESSGAQLEGIDPVRERAVTDLQRRVRRGRFDLSGYSEVHPRGAGSPPVRAYPVLIGFQLAKNLKVDVGGELVLITQAADGSIGNGIFEVRGVMQSIDGTFDRLGVLLSREGFNSLMALPGGAHEWAVRTPDASTEAIGAVRDELDARIAAWPGSEAFAQDPGGAAVVRTWYEINATLHGMIQSSQGVILVVAVIVFVIASLSILNTMLMATYERRHELGILLALGMNRWAMMAMVMLEAAFLALCATAVGSAAGVALAWYLQVYGIDYSRWLPEGLQFLGVVMDPVYYGYLLPKHVWISVLNMLATALVAALLPSWRTARLNPAAAVQR